MTNHNYGFNPLPEEVRNTVVAGAEEEPMSTSPAQQKYQELRSKIADAKKQMEQTARGLFTEMSAELFKENPTLVSFRWEQYTPYWNDGDVCTFRCHGGYPTVSIMVDGDVMGYDSNRGNLKMNGNEVRTHEEYERMFKGMRGSKVSSIVEDGKTVSYDPATKTVTKDGVKVPTYDEYHQMFAGLEKKVGAFVKNFEDGDMETMFGDHVQVTINRDGKVETEEYDHE